MKLKATVYDLSGNKKGELELPAFFSNPIRADIAAKSFETWKMMNQHLYSGYKEAGKRHSASGTISHQRHDWKGHYGKGISRVPRKTMNRRGTQFFWVATEVSGTRGGRRSHTPLGFRAPRKINYKEMQMALHSAFAATASEKYIQQRYSSLENVKTAFPIVVESVPAKSKDVLILLKKILGTLHDLTPRRKSVRPGKGKLRGRKYKSSAGLLVVKGKDEKVQMKGLDIRTAREVSIADLYPLGRLTIFTHKGMEELKNVA
ncbi:50S ribosomal protein L4 [Candidatus Pacearchaeota archaeon]|nr:50S ribosomal protein L4 [Candidatus Pacearchaeota archaeon]